MKLTNIADYVTEKISSEDISLENYITTYNLLPDKQGRTIASNLLKLIPGVGTAVGGTISGATAGLLTTALGEAYIKILEMIYKGEMKQEELDTPEGQKKIKTIFLDMLRKKK